MLVLAFIGKVPEPLVKPGVAAAVIIIIFVISAIYVFGPAVKDLSMQETTAGKATYNFFDVITQPAVLGTILMLGLGAVIAYVLSKK
jgi:hypothetical protein